MKRLNLYLGLVLLLAIFGIDCASHSRLKPPRVASDRPLDYPLNAQLKRIEGEVELTVFVNPLGKPEDVNLTTSSGYEELDDAALNFVKKLDFSPGTLDDKPVSAWTKLVLRYRLTEQAFEKDRWLADVHQLQRELGKTTDSQLRDTYLKRLYTNYIGCHSYTQVESDLAVNSLIRSVITRDVEKRWSPFWSQYAAPFALFDDFLIRYPNSSVAMQARQDLVRFLMEMETRIRMDSLRSRRISRTANQYIDLIESRLTELQKEIDPTEE